MQNKNIHNESARVTQQVRQHSWRTWIVTFWVGTFHLMQYALGNIKDNSFCIVPPKQKVFDSIECIVNCDTEIKNLIQPRFFCCLGVLWWCFTMTWNCPSRLIEHFCHVHHMIFHRMHSGKINMLLIKALKLISYTSLQLQTGFHCSVSKAGLRAGQHLKRRGVQLLSDGSKNMLLKYPLQGHSKAALPEEKDFLAIIASVWCIKETKWFQVRGHGDSQSNSNSLE